jgi:hypothetical protein
MPKKVECIRTSSEPEREVDGLVTHFAKHLSFVFCVEFRKGDVIICFLATAYDDVCTGNRKNKNHER